jgi:hypothetical protein
MHRQLMGYEECASMLFSSQEEIQIINGLLSYLFVANPVWKSKSIGQAKIRTSFKGIRGHARQCSHLQTDWKSVSKPIQWPWLSLALLIWDLPHSREML